MKSGPLLALGALLSGAGATDSRAPVPAIADRFTPADASAVRLHGLLGRYVDGVRDTFILHTNIVSTYLAPLEEHTDKTWKSEHIGKWLDAACTTWKYTGDSKVSALMEEAVKRMLAVQQSNGWLGGYPESNRFCNVDWNRRSGPGSGDDRWPGWDLWCNFMSLEGLLKYHQTRAEDTNAFSAAGRIGDLIAQTFGDGKQDIALVPHDNGVGAMSVMLGVAHLYEITGEPRYLEFCRYVVRQFGRTNTTPFIMAGSRGPEADRFPFTATGAVLKHAESELILRALCELYRMTGEREFLATCRNVYDAAYAPLTQSLCLAGYNSAETGKPWPRTVRERVETCDIPPMLRWWVEMFRLTGEVRYLNAVEREVYNQLLCFRTPDGRAYGYMSAKHLTCASGCSRAYSNMDVFNCCWSMGPVGICDLPLWCYFTSPEGILVNFYEPSSFQGTVAGIRVSLSLAGGYPIDGAIELSVTPERPLTFAVQLRIPEWAMAAEVKVNGRPWEQKPVPGTILNLKREWRSGDRVVLNLPMTPQVIQPTDWAQGFYLVERGPLLLAMSRRFNPIGEGWCYVAPVTSTNGALDLERVSLNDSVGQATVGWRTPAVSRLHTGRGFVRTTSVATLVPFYDAGAQRDPYVTAFPFVNTLESLPPRLGPSRDPNLATVLAGALATSDSDSKDHESCATYAIDGDPHTGWYSVTNDCPHWLDVKLSAPKRLRRLVLKFGDRDNHPVDFRLIAAVADKPAKEILAVRNCKLSDYFWAQFAPVEADRLRLIIEKSSDDPPAGAAISEFEVYEH